MPKYIWEKVKPGFKIVMTILILMGLGRITIIYKELRELNSKIDRLAMVLKLDLNSDKEK